MKINHLRFKAVGPFKEEFQIDFDELGAAALYLIDGPTGAGKTTIIDCIVYALYGETSVTGTDDSRIRSNFAGANDETFIEMKFTTTKGSFQVRRTPHYWRAKKNREGLTEEKPSASLFRLDSENEPITPSFANGVRDVNTEIGKVLGLTKQQFAQTIVLPQGQFAEFLRAKTADREPLLRKVFGVELFKRVTELLGDKVKSAKAGDQSAKQSILNCLAALNEHLDFATEDQAKLSGLIEIRADEDLAAEITAAVAELAGEAATKRDLAEISKSQREAAEARLAERKAEAAAATSLASAQTALDSACSTELESVGSLSQFAALVAEFAIDRDTGHPAEDWRAKKATVDIQIGKLDQVAASERKLASWAAEQKSLKAVVDAAQKAVDDLEGELETLPSKLRPLANAAAKQLAAQSELETLGHLGAGLLEQQNLHNEFESLQAHSNDLREKAAAALQTAIAADGRYRLLLYRRFRSMAAELASELEAGVACTVCGSPDHPAPAKPTDDHVTAEELKAADAEAKSTRKVAEDLDNEYKKSTVQLDGVQKRLSSSRAELELSLADHAKRQAAAVQNADAAAANVTAKQELEQIQTKLLERKPEVVAKRAEAVQTLAAASKEHDELTELVAAARGDFASVAERLRATETLSNALMTVAEAAVKRAAAELALSEAKAAYGALKQHADFGNTETATAEFEAAKSAAEAALLAANRAVERQQAGATKANELQQLTAARREAYAANSTLLEVDRLFSKNDAGMSLEIFVLQQLFDNVIAAANRRFQTLLEGRFQLVSSGEGDQRGKRGLGLNVLDLALNEERVANTLSGGETFCASLALALGLADVVRAEAGGIAIDTLFVDEGFGSLDMDRLNDVMNMLQALQAHGRTVGVISHVEEMKNQIGESIKVIPGSKGEPSSLKVSWMQ